MSVAALFLKLIEWFVSYFQKVVIKSLEGSCTITIN